MYANTNRADVKVSQWPYNLLEQIGLENDDPLDHMSTEAELYLVMSLSHMTEREMLILKLRYFEQHTLKETGDMLGVTGARIREVEAKAIRKLRWKECGYILTHGAKAYIDKRVNERVDAALRLRMAELEAEYVKKMSAAVVKDDESRRNAEEKLKEIAITDLELSLRPVNCLKRVRIRTVGELMERYPTYKELMTVRNLGRKSMEEVVDRVQQLGFNNWPTYDKNEDR